MNEGFFGRVSENASDVPEPVAIARTQGFLAAFRFMVARKIPCSLDETSATVCHFPRLPWRSSMFTSTRSLVASRPQTLTVVPLRYAVNGNRQAVSTGFGRTP